MTIGTPRHNEPLVTIAQTATDSWEITRNGPGLTTYHLGVYATAYDAVGEIRHLHPATDVIEGSYPAYPIGVLERLDAELANAITDAGLLGDIADVTLGRSAIAFRNGHPFQHLLLLQSESEWRIVGESINGLGVIRTYDDCTDAVADIQELLSNER